jgi:hypothetical protein
LDEIDEHNAIEELMGEGMRPNGIALLSLEDREEVCKDLFIILVELLSYPLNAEGVLMFLPYSLGVKDAIGANPVEDLQIGVVGGFGV